MLTRDKLTIEAAGEVERFFSITGLAHLDVKIVPTGIAVSMIFLDKNSCVIVTPQVALAFAAAIVWRVEQGQPTKGIKP